MKDDDFERAVVSWLALRGYLITKVDVVDVEVDGQKVEVFEMPSMVDSDFATFWNMYPRKVGKPSAEKAFKRFAVEAPAILAGLENHLNSGTFSKEMKFIPHPSTWLNDQRWKNKPEKYNASRPQSFKKPQVGGRTRSALDAFLNED